MKHTKEELLKLTKKDLIALCPRPPAKNYSKEQIANLVLAIQEVREDLQEDVEADGKYLVVANTPAPMEFVHNGVKFRKTYNAKGDVVKTEVVE